jgi:hypothetical protein
LLLGAADDGDHMVLVDTRSHEVIADRTTQTDYWYPRLSPSGHLLAVQQDQIDVIDPITFEHQTIATDADEIQAQRDHHSDTLLAIEVSHASSGEATATLLRYDLTGYTASQPLPAPQVEWSLPGYDWDQWFSFTWIGISPDDHWAVFPLLRGTEHVLLVLDQTTGGVTLVPGSGPVGFTRDSSRIVSYGLAADNGEDLWLIDPTTGTRQTVVMPFRSPLSFAITDDTDTIVCSPTGGNTYALVDPATGAVRSFDANVALEDWISRPADGSLWTDSGGALTSLSTRDAKASGVSVPAAISTINVLPAADRALIGAKDTATIWRVAMAERAIAGPTIQLPDPFDAPPIATLPSPGVGGRYGVESAFDPEYRNPELTRPGLVSSRSR